MCIAAGSCYPEGVVIKGKNIAFHSRRHQRKSVAYTISKSYIMYVCECGDFPEQIMIIV